MFDKKTVDAYQNIKAPDDLKEKILSSYAVSKAPERRSWIKNMRLISSLAACLLLAVAFSVFAIRNFGEVSVSVGGKSLASEPVELSELNISPALYSIEPRVSYEANVPVEIRVTGETRVSVSDGTMVISDADTGTVLYTGSEYTAGEDIAILWTVSSGTDTEQFEMLIDSSKKDFVLVLNYDENTGGWTIRKETLTD